MDTGAWQATVCRVTKELDMTWLLNNNCELVSVICLLEVFFFFLICYIEIILRIGFCKD